VHGDEKCPKCLFLCGVNCKYESVMVFHDEVFVCVFCSSRVEIKQNNEIFILFTPYDYYYESFFFRGFYGRISVEKK